MFLVTNHVAVLLFLLDWREKVISSLFISVVNDVPVAPPRSKHYARKYAARKKKSELDSLISRSVNGMPKRTKSPQGRCSKLVQTLPRRCSSTGLCIDHP